MEPKIYRRLLTLWRAYAEYVKSNLLTNTEVDLKDIEYWRSSIFVKTITYILPLSIFALIPSAVIAIINGIPIIAIADGTVFILLMILATNTRLTMAQRKFILIGIAYAIALILLLFQSESGPGLLFLLSVTIFASIVTSSSVANLSVWANALICFIFWLLLYSRVNIPLSEKFDAGTWIAISSNLIFLSFICSKLLVSLIKGMESSFLYGKRLHANLVSTINSTEATIYSLDLSLRYISYNKVLQDTMRENYNTDIRIGDRIFMPADEQSDEALFWTGAYANVLSGQRMRFERDYTVGANEITAHFSMNPIRKDDQIIGLSCFAIDVTTQKKLRTERDKITSDLLVRNKNLEQFSYIVSHNLRAPATNILGFAELLKTETLTPTEVTDAVNSISGAANKLDGVIKDLNEILKVRTSKIEDMQYVYFQDLVDDISLSIDSIAGHHLRIHTDFSEVERLTTLKSYLYSIFDNLIRNSVKFKSPSRKLLIEITSRQTAGGIQLVFRDNGIGINLSKNKDRIFGLYNRFHVDIEGKGMGLFMVKTQVEVLGGKITVSSSLNTGTEFTINFHNITSERKLEIA